MSDVSYSVSMSGKKLYFDFFIDMKPYDVLFTLVSK